MVSISILEIHTIVLQYSYMHAADRGRTDNTLVHMAASCRLRAASKPIVLRSQPGAVVEDMWIRVSTSGVAALRCIDSPGVVLRRLRIEHAHDGVGIKFERCDRIRIEDVAISALDARKRPNRCSLPFNDCDNIHGVRSREVVIERVRVSGGSTGIELRRCERAHLRSIIAMNVLGPYPRGQCVQFSSSPYAHLDEFLCRNRPYDSWTEDSISVWRSAHVRVSNGLIDGNNSPTGVGIIFENDDAHSTGGSIHNVDAIHMGNGCFSGYPARELSMSRVRCGWNHCNGTGGRGPPASGGQMWAAGQPTKFDPWEMNQLHEVRKAQATALATGRAATPPSAASSSAALAATQPKRRRKDERDGGRQLRKTQTHSTAVRAASALHDWNISSRKIVISHATYFAPCDRSKPPAWEKHPGAYSHVNIQERHFVPRAPLELSFCWESAGRL